MSKWIVRLPLFALLAAVSAIAQPVCRTSGVQWLYSGNIVGNGCEATCVDSTGHPYQCPGQPVSCNTPPPNIGKYCSLYVGPPKGYIPGFYRCPGDVNFVNGKYQANMYGYTDANDSVGCHPSPCTCVSASPIVIDTQNEGWHMTSEAAGVMFQIGGPGLPATQTAWTDSNYHNGWLVADLNGNGVIDDASEMFGNAMLQNSEDGTFNGFNALAMHDSNGDGIIDANDTYIWPKIFIWIDSNHDGVSQSSELFPPSHFKITGFNYLHDQASFTDPNGNQFNFESSPTLCTGLPLRCGGIRVSSGSKVATTYYDVFPVYDGTNWQ